MLTVATCFWQANRHSAPASRCYTPDWVNRLAAGVRRNLSQPHRFVALTDQAYEFAEGVERQPLASAEPDWSSMIEPFRLEGPLMVMGLDTVITGALDELASWCELGDRIALPLSPGKTYACNGVALVPAGCTDIHTRWRGENDMEWLRDQPHAFIDDLFPGQVKSFKCDVRPPIEDRGGLGDARIVYFHGRPKMQDLLGESWIQEHWLGNQST